ncbi:unnamed protein product [Cylindrotheca closterium]|uniref:Gamma-glutamyltransferase n=1 Tax=Cylindrotheca closterium TaxID=2856 RepID=A0AAD2FC03_9STRA|nr:unnamed protein product [Cylindrotheca closterium]
MKDLSPDATETTPFVKQTKKYPAPRRPNPSWVGCGFLVYLLGVGTVLLLFRVHVPQLSGQDEYHLDPIKSLQEDSSIENISHGVVASDHEVCSKIGVSILSDGGNAIDAAVSTMLCLGVANPASSGLGGGAFILIQGDKSHFENRTAAQQTANMPPFHDARDKPPLESRGKILEVIDCRETAPSASTEDMFGDMPASASSFGGLAIAVPGELRGLELAHARHGKLPWKTVVSPAISLAENGVPISTHLATDISEILNKDELKIGKFANLRAFLTKTDSGWGNYRKTGELLKNPALAETLRIVAQKGGDGFYMGEIAQQLVDDVGAENGILTIEDMKNYKATLRSPLLSSVNGFSIVGVPPPSSGGATLIGAARFLSGYKSPLASESDTLSVHRTVEALRHAFALRMSLCDPAFNTNKTREAVKDLVEGEYMENLRRISKDRDTLPLSMYGGKKWAQLQDSDGRIKSIEDAHEGDRRLKRRRLGRPFGYLEDSGTSHLSVVDIEGNAVSVTSSINQVFGSYVFSESTGVLMGNTMDDFGNPGRSNYYGLKPSPENFVAPGKRPLSSMSPTFVFREDENCGHGDIGALKLVIGGSGGPKIISSVLQVFINYCLLGMPLFEALVRPRIHEQLVYHNAAVTTTENDHLDQGPLLQVPQRTKDALLSRGHKALLDIDYAGTVQAVGVDLETDLMTGVSDPRKGGTPAGY